MTPDIRAFIRDHAIFLTTLSLVMVGTTFAIAATTTSHRSDTQSAFIAGSVHLAAEGGGGSSPSAGSGSGSDSWNGGGASGGTQARDGSQSASDNNGSRPGGQSTGGSEGGREGGSPGGTSSGTGGSPSGGSPSSNSNSGSGGNPTGGTSNGNGGTGPRGPLGANGEARTPQQVAQQQQAARTQQYANNLSKVADAKAASTLSKIGETVTRATQSMLSSFGKTVSGLSSPKTPQDGVVKSLNQALGDLSKPSNFSSPQTTQTSGVRGPLGPNGEAKTPEQVDQQQELRQQDADRLAESLEQRARQTVMREDGSFRDPETGATEIDINKEGPRAPQARSEEELAKEIEDRVRQRVMDDIGEVFDPNGNRPPGDQTSPPTIQRAAPITTRTIVGDRPEDDITITDLPELPAKPPEQPQTAATQPPKKPANPLEGLEIRIITVTDIPNNLPQVNLPRIGAPSGPTTNPEGKSDLDPSAKKTDAETPKSETPTGPTGPTQPRTSTPSAAEVDTYTRVAEAAAKAAAAKAAQDAANAAKAKAAKDAADARVAAADAQAKAAKAAQDAKAAKEAADAQAAKEAASKAAQDAANASKAKAAEEAAKAKAEKDAADAAKAKAEKDAADAAKAKAADDAAKAKAAEDAAKAKAEADAAKAKAAEAGDENGQPAQPPSRGDGDSDQESRQPEPPGNNNEKNEGPVTQPFMTDEKAEIRAKLLADEAKLLERAKKLQDELGGQIEIPDAVVAINEIIKTTAGEAGGEEIDDQVAVANAILNRIKVRATTRDRVEVHGVLTGFDANMQRGGTPENRVYAGADVGSPQYDRAAEAVDAVLEGDLPADMPAEVKTATHYFNPAQSSPDWGKGFNSDYGKHRFGNDGNVGMSAAEVAEARAKVAKGEVKAEVVYGGTDAQIKKEVARAQAVAAKIPKNPDPTKKPQDQLPENPNAELTQMVTKATLKTKDPLPKGEDKPGENKPGEDTQNQAKQGEDVQVVPTSGDPGGSGSENAPGSTPQTGDEGGDGTPRGQQPMTFPIGGSMKGASMLDAGRVPYSGGAPNSRSFGGPRKPGKDGKKRFHTGVDIPGTPGDPMYAIMDGEVVRSELTTNGYGHTIDIKYPDGTVHRMAHLQSRGVKVGDKVKKGQVVGKLGYSGNAGPEFPHTHYEVIKGEYYEATGGRPAGRAPSKAELEKGRLDPRAYFKEAEKAVVAGTKTTDDVAEIKEVTVIPRSLIRNKPVPAKPADAGEQGDPSDGETEGVDEGTPASVENIAEVQSKVDETKEKASKEPSDLKKTLDGIAERLQGELSIDDAKKALKEAYDAITEAGAVPAVTFEEYDPKKAGQYTYTFTVPSRAIDPSFVDAFAPKAIREDLKKQISRLQSIPEMIIKGPAYKVGMIVKDSALTKPAAAEPPTNETPQQPAAEVPAVPQEQPALEAPQQPAQPATPEIRAEEGVLEVVDDKGKKFAEVKKAPDGTLTLSGEQPVAGAPNGTEKVQIDGENYEITFDGQGKARSIEKVAEAPAEEEQSQEAPQTEDEGVVPQKEKPNKVVTVVKRILDWIGLGGDSEQNIGTTTPSRTN